MNFSTAASGAQSPSNPNDTRQVFAAVNCDGSLSKTGDVEEILPPAMPREVTTPSSNPSSTFGAELVKASNSKVCNIS